MTLWVTIIFILFLFIYLMDSPTGTKPGRGGLQEEKNRQSYSD